MHTNKNQLAFKATNLLIVINIVVMILILAYNMATYGSLTLKSESLISFGAILPNKSSLLTIVSSMFLHAGFLHIIMNMISLKVFGDDMEPILGVYYLGLYLLSGIFSNLVIYFFTSNLTVGASGAICGIWGAKIVYTFKYNLPNSKKIPIVLDTIVLLGIGFLPFVSGTGHFVGLVSGALMSWFFYTFMNNFETDKKQDLAE